MTQLVLDHTGDQIAFGTHSGQIKFYEIASGKCVKEYTRQPGAKIDGLAVDYLGRVAYSTRTELKVLNPEMTQDLRTCAIFKQNSSSLSFDNKIWISSSRKKGLFFAQQDKVILISFIDLGLTTFTLSKSNPTSFFNPSFSCFVGR